MNRILPVFVLLSALVCTVPSFAQDEADTPEMAPVTEVFLSETIPVALPAFHDAERAGAKLSGLIEAMPALPGAGWPQAGEGFTGPGGRQNTWTVIRDRDGRFELRGGDDPAARYLAFTLTADRWQKAELSVTTDRAVHAVLNGKSVTLKKDADEDGPAVHTAELTLTVGTHLVCLRSLDEGDQEGDWTLGLGLTPAADLPPEALVVTAGADRRVTIQTILDAPRISGVELSPDGILAAITMGEYRDGSHHETWLEIRDTRDGRLLHFQRDQEALSRVQWLPEGRVLSWQTAHEGKTTVWTYDLADGTTAAVLQDVEKLGSWLWAPDGGSMVYQINRTPDPDKRKVKRVAHPADRQSWYRGRSHLEQVFVPGGMTRRLTAGPISPQGWSFSPDGSRLLFFTSEPELTARPYFTSTLWLMDLESLAVEQILDDPWVSGAEFSPDGRSLCLRGSPSAFDGMGRNLPEGVQANDYGGQLFLFELKSRTAEPISIDFVPDVGWYDWREADGKIYARCTDTQYSTIHRYDVGDGTWERVDTGLEYTNQIALSRSGDTAVARGTDANRPNRLFTVDLGQGKTRLLLDPGIEDYRDITFGKVESWVASLPKGEELDGFVYYPPHFDPAKKYPLIVYYYGGTSPVTRDFGGRYPKNVWAGQDYVVYVPNPSGATGYGQEFAARHVNDWGILTADEVIEATTAFLGTFDFADPERVGCIGASYGGFLTEYIVTQTDIFAAAVSHAGISDISSYWGEGLWGYAYGARALANSFPWADRELFVEQSPLFHADKITTPLLLVHGDSDTNVPKGESDQLFTALKLLGREVEYVQIQGQDHHILDHDQRIVWNDTILAFFAKYLKGRPDWWNELYPEPKDWR